MRILGIDPALGNVGWGVIVKDKGSCRVLGHGTIKTSSSKPLPQRLTVIYGEILKVIESFVPCEAGIEEVFVNQNPKSTLKLGMARGVALLALSNKNIPLTEYPPNQVKKAIVGKGHANKDQMIWMIQKLLNIPSIQNDEADALAIALCHDHYRLWRQL